STTCLTTASKPWGGSWPTAPNWKRPGGCSSTSTASTSPKTQTRPTRRLGRSSTFGTTHPLVEFDRLVETLLEWGDEIFACHDTDRITNGRIEGTNNRLGVLKRVAYGFLNVSNFAARALLLTPGMATSP